MRKARRRFTRKYADDMLQYLIILLDDTSVSFCHYDNPCIKQRIIPFETLKKGIRFGMKENLTIQFVFPSYELPEEYLVAIDSIDHTNIKPIKDGADVWVSKTFTSLSVDIPIVLRLSKAVLFSHKEKICRMLGKTTRLNIVLTNIDSFTDDDSVAYQRTLDFISQEIERLILEGRRPQMNLLTDRMMLSQMNNCGAGDSCITLAPNGKLYVCPAFYYEDEDNSIGDLCHGVDIKNKQLYRLDHAPICYHCDAWQCKRCIWLNRKMTHEVNTPSHEQCLIAHIERNESRKLLNNVRKHGQLLMELEEIKEIDYLDPFDKRDEW